MKNKPKKNTKFEKKTKHKMEETNMSATNIGVEKESNNKTRLTLAERLPTGWREYFKKKDVLLKIMEEAGLTLTHYFFKVKTTYLVDDNRIALIVLLLRKDTQIVDKLVIDAISGYPQFEQIMDVLYAVGVDCDYRIILGVTDSKTLGYHLSFLDEIDGCVDLTVMGIELGIKDTEVIDFNCFCKEKIFKDTKNDGLQPRKYYEEREFWNSYFIPHHRYGDECTEDSVWFPDGVYGGYHENGTWMASTASWDEDGIKITFEIEEEDLKWLLTNKLEEIKYIFDGCTIAEWEQDKNSASIAEYVPACDVLDVWPIDQKYRLMETLMTTCIPVPFRNFIYSSPDDKGSYTRNFMFYATVILYLEELVWEGRYRN